MTSTSASLQATAIASLPVMSAVSSGLRVGVIQTFRRHVEARIRAMQPAQRALDAGIEINHRAHGARGELFECRIAIRAEATLGMAYGIFNSSACRNAGDCYAFPHFMPLRQIKLVRRFRISLIGTNRNALG